MIQINILSARTSFDFTGNKPAISAFKSAEVTEEGHEEQGLKDSSTLPSYSMLSEPHSRLISYEGVNWIAGVGDVCNRAFHDETHQQGCSIPQDINAVEASKQGSTAADKDADGHSKSNTRRSALQRHCDFWDNDRDGLIYPWDIAIGFRKLGFNMALCLWAAITMAICSSYSTQANWLPHPLFAINVDNIHRSRHGSTTGTYDLDAEIDMRRFDAIFAKYAEGRDYLTAGTLYDVWVGQCCANDWFGWFAGGLECECSETDSITSQLTIARDRTVYSVMASGWQVEEGRCSRGFRRYYFR
jgi:hypothetical protein